MNLGRFENIYLVGLGGIGMSALARYFLHEGKKVAGYDRTSTTLTDQLQAEGMDIHFTDSVENIPGLFQSKENTLVIYTPAIPKNHNELNYFITNGFEVAKRSQILGWIAESYKLAAVAGTHGKTTTSSILAHMLKTSSQGCNAFLGGITKNYNSNFIYTEGSQNMVAEADEYDRSFLKLFPKVAIITSMDADHLDIYGTGDALSSSFHEFVNNIKEAGTLIYKKGLDFSGFDKQAYSYSLAEGDYHAANVNVVDGKYVFDLVSPNGVWKELTFGYPGKHNVENAIAATAVAQIMGVTEAEVREALHTFTGIKRRFDYQVNTPELVYIDDYAHHPAELETCIKSVRDLYPMKEITGVFQPHLFSRTRDFAEGFAASLSLLDELVMLPIYPAREEPIEGVTSEMVLNNVSMEKKQMSTKGEVANLLASKELEVLLTLGAGDIDTTVEPIRKMLLDKLSMGYPA